jgi:AcrR family transcriptional regulator
VPLIQETGYDAFSLEALAARAGVGKATIYRRWSSKEGVAVEALQRFVSRIPTPDLGDLRADLIAVLTSDATLHSDPRTPALLSSLLAATARSPRIAEAVRQGFVASRERALTVILERAKGRGEIPADLDLRLAVELCAGVFLYRTLVSGVATEAAMLPDLARLLLGGLCGPSNPQAEL